MLVQDIVHVEGFHGFVDGDARVFQGGHQIHRVGVARFQIAVCVGIRRVGSQAEENDLVLLGKGQHAIVILHDHGAFLALPDGQGLGGGHHVLDGGVVLLEPGRAFIVDGHVAAGAQHPVELAAVVLRQALA